MGFKQFCDLMMFRKPVEASPRPEEVPPAPEPPVWPVAAVPVPGDASPGPGKPLPKKTIGAAALAIIAATLVYEGGYVNDPADPGGETNYGITKKVAVKNGYTGPMRTIPHDIVVGIYYDDYLVKPGYEPLIALDAPVVEELYDTTVNMGVPRPSKWFQQSLNENCSMSIVVDGQIGPSTVSAYAVCQSHIGPAKLCVAMLNSLDAKQKAEYDRLVRVNPKLKKFYRGWVNVRINNVDRRKCTGGPK